MENNNRKWTNDDLQFLIENYSNCGISYCAEYLKRSKGAIMDKAHSLNLKLSKSVKSKTNVIHTYEKVLAAVQESLCLSDVIRKLGLVPQAGNFENIKNRIKDYNIDISHFKTPAELTKLRHANGEYKVTFKEMPLESLLIINKKRLDNSKIKERLVKEGLKEYKCEGENCSVKNEWLGKKLILRLDHINGNNTDYRLENLRLLCPNCDSQTETYCSKNRIVKTPLEKSNNKCLESKSCKECGNKFKPNSYKQIFCTTKCNKKSQQKKRKQNKKVLKIE